MEKNVIEAIEKLEDDIDAYKILNINIGILGHVDSGKTSLAKKLSTVASTASFDKNPQSKERGITLDLGFSAFYIKTPDYLKSKYLENERLQKSEFLQITLVDCPGHASLIKTVIAGANIIDSIVLVIDIAKGIQTQTTECLILGEILADKITVALNKIDMIPSNNRENEISNRISKLRLAFGQTKFGKDVTIIPVSADPKDLDNKSIENNNDKKPSENLLTNPDLNEFDNSKLNQYKYNLNNLIKAIIENVDFNKNNLKNITKKEFLFQIDHCFNIKNKGTIVTGTILKGKVSTNDEIYFPELCEKKAVKEMQMFKKPISTAYQGDRVGMLIKNLDHTKIERSIACNEGLVQSIEGGIFILKKIKFYKSEIKSNTKFYIILGNQGVMAKCLFFNKQLTSNKDLINTQDQVNLSKVSVNLKQVYHTDFNYEEKLVNYDDFTFAYLKFDQKLMIPPDMIALGSRIDFDVSHKSNRIAFYGKIVDNLSDANKIKVFKIKNKTGGILRLVDDQTAIVKSLFKKDSNVDDFIGKKVSINESNRKIEGIILSKFGQSGKVKVEFNSPIRNLKLKNSEGNEVDYNSFSIVLEYKKYVKF
jgi:selenocysteine-specific elongation factor